jgi:hypothetical protein
MSLIRLSWKEFKHCCVGLLVGSNKREAKKNDPSLSEKRIERENDGWKRNDDACDIQ